MRPGAEFAGVSGPAFTPAGIPVDGCSQRPGAGAATAPCGAATIPGAGNTEVAVPGACNVDGAGMGADGAAETPGVVAITLPLG